VQLDFESIIWIIAVILLLGVSLYLSGKARKSSRKLRDSSLEILKKQFDNGEITKEVFEAKKKKLK